MQVSASRLHQQSYETAITARQVATTTFEVGNESFRSQITFSIDNIVRNSTAGTSTVTLTATNDPIFGGGFIPRLDLSATVGGVTQSTGSFLSDPGSTDTFAFTFDSTDPLSATATWLDTGETFTINEEGGGGFTRTQIAAAAVIVFLVLYFVTRDFGR